MMAQWPYLSLGLSPRASMVVKASLWLDCWLENIAMCKCFVSKLSPGSDLAHSLSYSLTLFLSNLVWSLCVVVVVVVVVGLEEKMDRLIDWFDSRSFCFVFVFFVVREQDPKYHVIFSVDNQLKLWSSRDRLFPDRIFILVFCEISQGTEYYFFFLFPFLKFFCNLLSSRVLSDSLLSSLPQFFGRSLGGSCRGFRYSFPRDFD